MQSKVSKHTLLLCLLLIAILLMGIGYATINSITLDIEGEVKTTIQKDIFITDVVCTTNIGEGTITDIDYEIEYFQGTYLRSMVKLSDANPRSEITFKVTVYNNSNNIYPFLDVLYDEEFYDNENIIFEISGFNYGDKILAKQTKDIYITFKYKNTTIPANNILNSNLNFYIAEPNRMVLANSVVATGNYLGGSITKETIEKIEFKLGTTAPSGTVAQFDASLAGDESIMGYYTDTDANELYELTFLSAQVIAPNTNSRYLFQNLTNLEEIKFDNFTTYGVTNMFSMFNKCAKLTTLDVSNFDTSSVTTMYSMFNGCENITTLDVSNFSTSNVTSMGFMFYGCKKLATLDISNFTTSNTTSFSSMFYNCSALTTLNLNNFNTNEVTAMNSMFYGCSGITTLDLSSFNTSKVTNMTYMFNNCSTLTTIYVSVYDSTANTGWTTTAVTSSTKMFSNCTELVGGNGTGYNATYIDATYARIDKKGAPGYFTEKTTI